MAKRKPHYFPYQGVQGATKPLKMLRLRDFATATNYTQKQCVKMLRQREIIGLTYKKWLYVAPCKHSSHLFTPNFINQFWGDELDG
jgi:hypothetical protein